jgi:hypothetical protein
MNSYEIIQMVDSTILYLYSMRDEIDLEPEYQRMSDVWNYGKRQLLVDSIINGYDIPKIYFHEHKTPITVGDKKYKYAVVDGKQRLQSIFEFIEGKINLASDFAYNFDDSIDLKGMTYGDLGKKQARIKIKFDSKVLPVFLIRTDDQDIIEDMFARLNEASPLNAAEKRNAFGGPVTKIIRKIAKHPFFVDKTPTSNSRYKHYDIAAKLLYLIEKNNIVDTKRIHLDSFVKKYVESDFPEAIEQKAVAILDEHSKIFVHYDPLIKNAGVIPILFWLSKLRYEIESSYALDRVEIQKFEEKRLLNRIRAQKEDSESKEVDLELLEYDRLLQSPNDSYSIRYKSEILAKNIFPKELAGKILERLTLKI